MKIPKPILLPLIFILLFALPGCLTVEKKKYHFELTGKNSGVLTITYYNIMSIKDNETDVSEKDFEELISSYLEGDMLKDDFPGIADVHKRLYEEDGVLCGEVIMEFDNLASARLFKYNKKSPYMFSFKALSENENFESGNCQYGGDIMPVAFWPGNKKNLRITTSVTVPDKTTVSLIEEFRNWKNNQ